MARKKVGIDERSHKQRTRDEYTVVLEQVNWKLDAIIEGITALRERVDHIEQRLDRLEQKMDTIELEVRMIRRELSQKVSLKQFQALERRVTALERQVPGR